MASMKRRVVRGAVGEMLGSSADSWEPVRVLLVAVKGFVLFCALMLPVLLVDLVWVGLVHGGVRSAVPTLVRADELSLAERGLSDEQISLVEACYSQPDERGVRHFEGMPDDLCPFSDLSRALSGRASMRRSAAACEGISSGSGAMPP